MQVGTLNVKLVIRKLQNNQKDYQVMLLAGFTPTLTHTTAPYVETLSPNHVLTQAEIDKVIAKLMHHSNAADHKDISNPGVTKKLAKLWGVQEVAAEVDKSFAGMGIGQYL